MEDTEAELLALQQARRESAEKHRSLLEQLEAAELEFASLTDKLKSLRAGHPKKLRDLLSTASLEDERNMKSKEVVNVWQLGLGAGMLFGFGSNAMEFFVPTPSLHLYVKSGLLIISCLLILTGYARVRRMVSVGENE